MPATFEQQPSESFEAYRYFCSFRDSEERPRVIKRVCEEFDVSETLIYGFSTKWRWAERVVDFDNFLAAPSLALRQVGLSDYAAALNQSLTAKLALVDKLLASELAAMRKEQEDGKKPLDGLRLQRLLTSLERSDSLLRRAGGLPTAYTRERSEQDSGDEAVYVVGP